MSEQSAIESVGEATVEQAREQAADAQRVIVKAGTNSLTDEDSQLDRVKLDKLVSDIMDLRKRGKDVLLVSSGAVGAGKGLIDEETETVEESQALSTVGQSHLMRHYTQSFDRYDQTVAQILLTEHDLANPERFTNVRNTIETLFDWGIVPIINENDAIATEEIQIGDNDMLSASVAIGVNADLLVTLTDVGGVYTGNPKDDDDAALIEAVGANYDAVQSLVDDSTTAEFGGIQTKVEGARDVSEHGTPAIIAGSADRDVLERIATAKSVGTLFVPINGATDD
ncbi:glutamate 5-kinase [Halomicrobium mukohataei]|uniref:Glutamate 5-kinase n=1 Tax=Halomicrobium mukohataei (strain ATCC 700874 / DSM 12286 / JCM 9738 / NCIMB 13541) TaxID=485914 RepID=C7P583_HALMD|nr:glutamate 5-kinase [Halomicrobium mukohataei]ACV49478.1 glutamate 5-kinase [Halomicrobium mukohataei DSM 12286]